MVEGEYLEEDNGVFIREKVGEFSINRSEKFSSFNIEEIIEGEIIRETKVQTTNDINETFKSFGEKFGIKVDTQGAQTTTKT